MRMILVLLVVLTIGLPLSPGQPRKDSKAAKSVPKNDLRGTEDAPLTIKVLPPIKTPDEAAQEKREKQDQSDADWSLVKLTGILALIGIVQTIVFGLQARRLKHTIEKMDEIAGGQTNDMKASIAEATRAATAMEQISVSMQASIATASGTLRSVEAQSEIMARQTDIMERQTRLQEAAMMPWASVQNWQVSILERAAPVSDRPAVLQITFDLVNKSNLPCNTTGSLKFMGFLPGSAECILPGLTLLPDIPRQITIRVYPPDKQAIEFAEGELRISVHGEISHVGALRKQSPPMEIHGNIVCGKNVPTHLEFGDASIRQAEEG